MTDGFDWKAWAHGHIESVERENDGLREDNAALAARVRELEEAQGELLDLLDRDAYQTGYEDGYENGLVWAR